MTAEVSLSGSVEVGIDSGAESTVAVSLSGGDSSHRLESQGKAFAACRFAVSINDRIYGAFTEVSGLQLELDVHTLEEGGNNAGVRRFPGRAKMGNLILKRGLIDSSQMLVWLTDVAFGTVTRANVTLTLLNEANKAVVSWVFENAFPCKWSGPQLTGDSTLVAIETLELAFDTMKLGSSNG